MVKVIWMTFGSQKAGPQYLSLPTKHPKIEEKMTTPTEEEERMAMEAKLYQRRKRLRRKRRTEQKPTRTQPITQPTTIATASGYLENGGHRNHSPRFRIEAGILSRWNNLIYLFTFPLYTPGLGDEVTKVDR